MNTQTSKVKMLLAKARFMEAADLLKRMGLETQAMENLTVRVRGLVSQAKKEKRMFTPEEAELASKIREKIVRIGLQLCDSVTVR
jgi:hypothetical protein